jgi:hypothetical protein
MSACIMQDPRAFDLSALCHKTDPARLAQMMQTYCSSEIVGRMVGLSRIGVAQLSGKVPVSETVVNELVTAFITSG